MDLNSKEFVDAIIEHASTHGFPIDTERQPHYWTITERGGSFETRFSQTLGWLLNPKANHGCGIEPLQTFVDSMAKKLSWGQIQLEAKSTQVFVEKSWPKIGKKGRDRLDLLIIDHGQDILIAVEVKMDADDHEGQLNNYHAQIQDKYSHISQENRFFVYLTPDSREPTKLAGKDAIWQRLSYTELLPPIERALENLLPECVDRLSMQQRAVHVIEDLQILIKHRVSSFHQAIRERFIDDQQFFEEIAYVLLATEVAKPAEIRLQMKARIHKIGDLDLGEDQHMINASRFWEQANDQHMLSEVTPKYLTETRLESMVKSIWQVMLDEYTRRETNSDLNLYIDRECMEDVREVAEWFRDTLQNTPSKDSQSKVIVVGQGKLKRDPRVRNHWTIGVGASDAKEIPPLGRRGYIRFNVSDAVIKLEPNNNSDRLRSHHILRNNAGAEREILGDSVLEWTDDCVQIKVDSSDLEIKGRALQTIIAKACFNLM
ncbi:PD-(D/E)XK nuclease family protein [Glutamicibacter arilaitensis]|uniref:PD-(D/E)XK nuclease family protein n=1 Tax=Glutamicibacter arilaitensis TaxID=256701 RepID=UPI003FD52575